ncbi:MAG: cyanobacterial phytochrome A, partial [Candidatus Omnitrophica bacterium]|nr:cyanobacterial phytochrome A [Candidatus Omnitrophota bacterium]
AQATVNYKGLPQIFADEGQLAQVFQNLIGNSLKFRSENAPVIDIHSQLIEDEHIFSIKDNGIGIPKDYFIQIFDIFRRLHTEDEYPGTGIGLAICKKVIDNHGGRIWVESQFGHGATFYFTIPKKESLNVHSGI